MNSARRKNGEDFEAHYQELKRIAQNILARQGATLSATELVHELYLKLDRSEIQDQLDKKHFLALAAKAIRWILTDRFKAKYREKRGGNPIRVTLAEVPHSASAEVDALALKLALDSLEKEDPRACQAAELCLLAGLTYEEAAAVLEVSVATVKRDVVFAKAWLVKELGKEDAA